MGARILSKDGLHSGGGVMNNLLSFDVSRHRGEIGMLVVIEQMLEQATTERAKEAFGQPADSPAWKRVARSSNMQMTIQSIVDDTRHLRCDVAVIGKGSDDAKT